MIVPRSVFRGGFSRLSRNKCREQPEEEYGEYHNDWQGGQPGDDDGANHVPLDILLGLRKSDPQYGADQDMGCGYRQPHGAGSHYGSCRGESGTKGPTWSEGCNPGPDRMQDFVPQ